MLESVTSLLEKNEVIKNEYSFLLSKGNGNNIQQIIEYEAKAFMESIKRDISVYLICL